jgi:hypothetical protein
MNTAPAIDFARSRYDAYMQECGDTKAAVETAWLAHYEAVMRFKASKMWEAFAPNWETFCDNHKQEFFAASTYRQTRMNIPIAELAESVAGKTLSREQMNNIGRKLNEVIPEGERDSMKLSVLALTYAYHEKYQIEKPVPDKNVIEGAYHVLLEERENHTVSVDGTNYDFKQEGQVLQLREAIVQGIQAHSNRVTIAIERTGEIGLILRALRRMGHSVPSEDKKLFISWKG